MQTIPTLSWKQKEKIYTICGYKFRKQKGSHRSYYNINNPADIIILPAKKELPKGTVQSNIKKLKITREDFLKLVEQTK